MSQDPVQQASQLRRLLWFPAALAVSTVLIAGAGCQELNARRDLQDAARSYEKGKFEEATSKCDKALEALSDFDTALHNCAIIYYKGFKEMGIDKDERLRRANRAAELFGLYLKLNPKETRLIDFMSQTWIDSGQHEKALAYWEAEYAKDRKNTEVIVKIAAIHRMAGDWKKSLEWHEIESDAEETPQGKARALKNIGNIIASKLLYNRASIKWHERLATADIAIHAMQRAAALQPKNFDIQQLLGNLFASRGEAHQASWAQLIETAHSRYHYRQFSKLKLESEGKTLPPEPKPEETKPDETKPEGATPEGATPEGAKPEGAKPAASKPAASKPAASKPAASKPAASKPAASKPAASAPAASKPAASAPAASKPAEGAASDKPAPTPAAESAPAEAAKAAPGQP